MQTWLAIFLTSVVPPKEFHQGVAYRIEARLDDATHVLTGRTALRYTNKSGRALDTLYFHLHLNAFRPNSAFATRELQFNQRRFQDLGPDDYGFDRIKSITVNGRAHKPVFPNAPDSTVMAVPLTSKIVQNATALVKIDWQSRLSANAARRQGRKDRHYDFAHWYPRIAVFDTAGWQTQSLLPQGEFFGEFGTYDVLLDVASDHVVAATGTESAKPFTPLGLLGKTKKGRKRVHLWAEKVHHFAWSTDPDYVHEVGSLGAVKLHAYYLPGDTVWKEKVIAQMKSALQFFDTILGPYQYPQLTSAWRIDRGATEFPMFTSHSTPPAVVHETGHEWAHAMLANNEFKQGWLDEGFVSFLQFYYDEAAGRKPNYERIVGAIARMDSAGISQPLSLRSSEFRDFNVYQAMTYSKPAAVLHMLRFYIGDETMRRALRLYFDQNKLTHVDEEDFRRALEQAGKMDLREFFQQWFHTVGTADYAVVNASVAQDVGSWVTTVTVTRTGDNWIPVDLKVAEKTIRLDSRERQFTVQVRSATKPANVVLDPEFHIIDAKRSNNTFTF